MHTVEEKQIEGKAIFQVLSLHKVKSQWILVCIRNSTKDKLKALIDLWLCADWVASYTDLKNCWQSLSYMCCVFYHARMDCWMRRLTKHVLSSCSCTTCPELSHAMGSQIHTPRSKNKITWAKQWRILILNQSDFSILYILSMVHGVEQVLVLEWHAALCLNASILYEKEKISKSKFRVAF